MKGFFVKPKEPSKLILKLGLDNQISNLENPFDELKELFLNGNISVENYSYILQQTNSEQTRPYAFFHNLPTFIDVFQELHSHLYRAKKFF